MKAGAKSGGGDSDAGTSVVLDLAARFECLSWPEDVEGGSFVAVLTTLSHHVMGYGGVWESGPDWWWFCGGIDVMCGIMAEGGGGGSGRQYGVRVGVDTGWVDNDG